MRKSASYSPNSEFKENSGFQVKPLVAPYRSQVFDSHRDTRGAARPPVYMVDSEIRNNLNSFNPLSSNQTQNMRGRSNPEIPLISNSVFSLPNVVQENENASQI